eukprot:COSAG06_NODE_7988_length_2310_cov_6.644957_3_plen_549_part_00
MNPFRPSPLWAWISTDVMPVGLASQPREACSVGSCAAPHPCREHSNCTPTSTPARTGPGHPGFFRSEFGAVSWSSFEAMRAQLPSDQWSMQSACGGNDPHGCQQRNHRGDNLIQQFFGAAAAHPGTDTVGEQPFKRSLYRSMISALLMHKTSIESWRSQNVQGLLVWMLNDMWASGSWGSLEYGGRFKPLHYQLRTTFADQLVVCSTVAACYFRNDAPFPVSGTVTVRLLNVMTGAGSAMGNVSAVSLGAGAGAIHWFCATAQVGSSMLSRGYQQPSCMPWPDAPGWEQAACSLGGSDCVLVVSLHVESPHRNSTWTNLQPFVAPVRMQLPKATVTAVVGRQIAPNRVEVLLTASATALYVVLTCSVSGRFSDNALMLEGGKPRTVEFVGWAAKLGAGDAALLRSTLRVEHLAQHVGPLDVGGDSVTNLERVVARAQKTDDDTVLAQSKNDLHFFSWRGMAKESLHYSVAPPRPGAVGTKDASRILGTTVNMRRHGQFGRRIRGGGVWAEAADPPLPRWRRVTVVGLAQGLGDRLLLLSRTEKKADTK